MLRNLAWQATDTLTRTQFRMVQELGNSISLTEDDRRRALELDRTDWQAWCEFETDEGPLPAYPPMPEMLLRLGRAAFNLAHLAERRSVASGCQ